MEVKINKLMSIVANIHNVIKTTNDLGNLCQVFNGRMNDNSFDFDLNDFTFTIYEMNGEIKLSNSVEVYDDINGVFVGYINIERINNL